MDSTDIVMNRNLKLRVFNKIKVAKEKFSYQQIADECGIPLCSLFSMLNAHRLPIEIWQLADDGLNRLLEKE